MKMNIQQNMIRNMNSVSVEWHVGLEEKEKCEGVMVCSVILCIFSILLISVSTCGAKERNRRTETVKKKKKKIPTEINDITERRSGSPAQTERRSEKVLICVFQTALHQLSEQQGFPKVSLPAL